MTRLEWAGLVSCVIVSILGSLVILKLADLTNTAWLIALCPLLGFAAGIGARRLVRRIS